MATSTQQTTVIAHLSDLHLDATAEPLARAARAISHLTDLPHPLDAVLVTGDISDRGCAEDYVAFRTLISELTTPVLVSVGNHDSRVPFAAELLDRPDLLLEDPINQVLDLPGMRIVVIDSLIPGSSKGFLARQTLDWLDAALSAVPSVPVLVALHHPPVALGLPALDAIGLVNAEELKAIVSRHTQVIGVVCGHAHAATSTHFAGLPLRVAPGVRSSAIFPWERPTGKMMITREPVEFVFHTYATGVLTTFVRSV